MLQRPNKNVTESFLDCYMLTEWWLPSTKALTCYWLKQILCLGLVVHSKKLPTNIKNMTPNTYRLGCKPQGVQESNQQQFIYNKHFLIMKIDVTTKFLEVSSWKETFVSLNSSYYIFFLEFNSTTISWKNS